MEADDQRSRDRDRTLRSPLGSSSNSSPYSALTRVDRDRPHEAGTSSLQSQRSQQELSAAAITLFLQQSSGILTRDQHNLIDLCVALLHDDIIRARKQAKKLGDIDVDKAWGEVAEIYASRNPDRQKLGGLLHYAAQKAYKPMCKLLIRECKCDVNASMFDGKTPLMFSLNREGSESIVKYLIDNHADPNQADDSGFTPLHMAATQGYYEIAEYLLSKGANVDPLCQDGESPLFCAAIKGNERIVTLLLKYNADYNRLSKKLLTPLLMSLYGSSMNCLEILIEAGADVNGDGCSVTPLALAANKGLDGCIQCLLRSGANPNQADDSGFTPLHMAATQGYYEIAEYLLSKGANVDPLCEDGESPLFCAAIQGNERIVTLLLKHNADYNRLSKKLLTPLLVSLYSSSVNCSEILIEAGADVNGDGCSVTPLALAAYKGLDGCIQCLLRNGANPNVPDEDNNIPLQIAAVKGWEKCVEILLPHAPHLTQYEGLSISEIVQWERTERIRRSSRAIEQGDAAYWRKEHDIALRFYTEAAQVGLIDPALYAKMSLCHLSLRAPTKFIEEAINYMKMVQPNSSTPDPESDARKLVLDFARSWKELGSASRQGSEGSPTDETSSGEHQ